MKSIPCTIMRGGTSKGLYFLAKDLPTNIAERDEILLSIMGSPDVRQIDGLGGAHPLTSKVAIVSPSSRSDVDVEYLFLQIAVNSFQVSDSQTCGNLLAGVGPFAIENGLVAAEGTSTEIRILMINTDAIAVAQVETPNGEVCYDGDLRIDGVPGTAAPILLDFKDIAGSSCGKLLPTGNVLDKIEGVEVSCIDNGMPVVLIASTDLGVRGDESPEELESNDKLKKKIEEIRIAAGKLMNLGDVTKKTIPKMSLLSGSLTGAIINTRTFIPHRVHEAVGVLGAVSVASACVIQGSVAQRLCEREFSPGVHRLAIEHPTGSFTVDIEFENSKTVIFRRSALLRTARKLMKGEVFVKTKSEEQ